MEKEEQKSEFIQKLEMTAQDLKKAVESHKGKSFILIGADLVSEDEESRTTNTIIAVGGRGREIVQSLSEFISNPQTASFLKEAMKLAITKRFSEITNN